MPKPEWGVKRTCPSTGQRFYDLNKDPIISPYTGEVVDLKQTTAAVAKAAPKKAAPETETEQEDDLVVDDEDVEQEDATLDTGDDEDDDASGPALSDEDGDEDEPVEFQDDVLLDEDEDDSLGELNDVAKKDDTDG
jgi:uncharacterized protein (TIGR02300 family)